MLELRALKFAMPAPRQRFVRDPIVFAWELPRYDDTTLRYVVELRAPTQSELAAEARRRFDDGRTALAPTDLVLFFFDPRLSFF